MGCRKGKPKHHDTHFLTNAAPWSGFLNAVAKDLCLPFTLWSDDYLMRFDAGVLWALSELARAPMHFNVLPFFPNFFVVMHLSNSCTPCPPPSGLVFSFFYWTSKDRRIMMINLTKTSWKRSQRTQQLRSVQISVSERQTLCEPVWLLVCMNDFLWIALVSASLCTCFMHYPRNHSPPLWILCCYHLSFPTTGIPVREQDSKLDRLKLGDLSC